MFTSKAFTDARALLLDGVAALAPGQMVHLPHFNLMDAMNAIEIMDPRMDSGAALPPPADGASSPPGPPFDPQAPLLPEEVCWILDRAMACEMAYHTGLTLSQTVYTCLPLLPSSLPLLHPSALAEAPAFAGQTPAERARRPVELLALVLRAGVMGIAKSTGVVWDELMRGNLYDGEDFMGDKSGLTLCDGDDPTEILAALEDAVDWLAETDLVEKKWQDALLARLTLRSTLLRSLLEIYAPSSPIRPTTLALLPALLSAAQATPSPTELPLDSPARAAFDPAVSRQLTAHVPLSTVDLGLSWQADAWARMAALVDGLEEVGEAIWDDGMGGGWRNVVGWLDYLHLAGVTPARPQPSAFIRSLLLSVFYQPEENTIFNFTKLGHLSSLFLAEVAGVPAGVLRELVELSEDDRPLRADDGWDGRRLSEAVNVFCQRVDGFLVNSAMNLGQNRARSKRLAGKGTVQWEELYQEASSLVPLCQERLRLARYPEELVTTFANIPLAIALHRLLLVEHSLLTGFNLGLYAPPDHAMVWWALQRAYADEAGLWARLAGAAERAEEEEVGVGDRRVKVAAGWAAVCAVKFANAVGQQPTTAVDDDGLYARFVSRFKHLLPPLSKFAPSRPPPTDDDQFVPSWPAFLADVAAVAGRPAAAVPAAADREVLARKIEASSAELEELLPGAPKAYFALCRDMDARLAAALRFDTTSPSEAP